MDDFLRSWGPVILAFLCYEALRVLVPHLNSRVNITNLIQCEQNLFGQTIPTIRLQAWLFREGVKTWFDAFTLLIYSSHLYFYYLMAVVLWCSKRDLFLVFTRGFVLLTFASLITFIIFPAMPPWMASLQGYLPKVHRIIYESPVDVLNSRKFIVVVYQHFESNKIAAMPSLHSAWPFFTFLFLSYFCGKKWIPFILAPLAVGFSAVYLGEHYVIDVIGGYLYALIAFLISVKFLAKKYILK